MNRAFNLVPKRAESRQTEQLRDTFVDSGVSAALEAIDHQVLYGRRGTGKTHALRYLETVIAAAGDIAVYADLRTLGSPEGLFTGEAVPPTERAARLLVDLLGHVHDALLTAAIEDDVLIADGSFVNKIDALLTAITTVRVVGEVEVSKEGEDQHSEKDSAHLASNWRQLRHSTSGREVRHKPPADVHKARRAVARNRSVLTSAR
jgi:hypothetical protein